MILNYQFLEDSTSYDSELGLILFAVIYSALQDKLDYSSR